jgi:signal transduction histidine kinase
MWLFNKDSSSFSLRGFRLRLLTSVKNIIFFISILMVMGNSTISNPSDTVVNVYGTTMDNTTPTLDNFTLVGKINANNMPVAAQLASFKSENAIIELNDSVNTMDNLLTKQMESADVIANLILAMLLVSIIWFPLRKQKLIPYVNVTDNRQYDLPSLSFNLRTSLNEIAGFACIVHGRMTDASSPNPKELVGKIIDESNHILSDLTKIESDSFNKLVDKEKLSALSFQCRTSLNNILGFSGLIQNGKLGEIPDDQKTHIGYIMHGSKAMLRAIPVD